MLTTLAVENYRSLRRLVVPLSRLTVVIGANGSGKSSLYRALRLLAESARNGTYPIQGTVRNGPVRLLLGFAGDEFGYAMDLGMPTPLNSEFNLDPEIKCEAVWGGPVLRAGTLQNERRGPSVRLRDADGVWHPAQHVLQPFDSMLSEVADPHRAPELLILREQIRSWRFYDYLLRCSPRGRRRVAGSGTRVATSGRRVPLTGHPARV